MCLLHCHDDQIRLNLPWFMTTSPHTVEDTFFCLFLWQGSRDWVLVSEEVCSLVQYDTSPQTSWSMSLLVFMLTAWLLSEVMADQYLFIQGFSLLKFVLNFNSVSSLRSAICFLWPLLWIILSDIRYPALLSGSRNLTCSQYLVTVSC